jgi:hypothetical protein
MKTVLLTLLISVSLLSCKKDKDNDCDVTKEKLAGSYKLTSFKISGVEFIGEFDDCEVDDILTLNTDFTFTYFDSGITCDGNDEGSWTLNGNTISIPAIEGGTGTIQSFNCKDLVITGTDGGINFTTTITKQ